MSSCRATQLFRSPTSRRITTARAVTRVAASAPRLAGALLVVLALSACRDRVGEPTDGTAVPPSPPSDTAPAMAVPEADLPRLVGEFFVAVTALEVGDADSAVARLEPWVAEVPGEAAAWANLAVARLRGNDLVGGEEAMAQARSLAPDNAAIAVVDAAVLARLNRTSEALDALRRAVAANADDLQARYALFEALDASGEAEAATAELLALRERVPANLATNVAALRRAATARDATAIAEAAGTIEARRVALPEEAREQLAVVQEALEAGQAESAAQAAVGLANVLLGSEAYRLDQETLATDFANVARPIRRPIMLPVPPARAADADEALTFVAEPVDGVTSASADARVRVLPAGQALAPTIVLVGDGGSGDDGAVRAAESGAEGAAVDTAEGVTTVDTAEGGVPTRVDAQALVALDVNNDGDPEWIAVDEAGARVVLAGPVAEVVGEQGAVPPVELGPLTGLGPAEAGTAWRGAWAVDVDLEGDLDLVLSPAAGGAPVVLRNQGDATWAVVEGEMLPGLTDLADLVWYDADADGDGDLVALDERGALHRYRNERAGVYIQEGVDGEGGSEGDSEGGGEIDVGPYAAMAVADADGDARLDLTVLGAADGTIRAIGADGSGTEVARWEGERPDAAGDGTGDGASDAAGADTSGAAEDPSGAPSSATVPARMHWADLDNNGALDLVVSWGESTQVWLGGPDASLSPFAAAIDGRVDEAVDVDGDGRVDLLGMAAGVPTIWRNAGGAQDYGWQALGFAALTTGDQRNNSFGVGGEVALRSELLLQVRPIEGPWLHVGLGGAKATNLIRVRWPNGSLQGEFDLTPSARVAVEQRLKGSCPWLFAWDGETMGFVTDILWRSPLGLRINGQATAGVVMTRDRVKVDGSRLAERDGMYDLRITAELWETHYFDHVGLLVVDHPAEVEVWLDERFQIPPPSLEPRATGPVRPVARALGDDGADVTAVVAERDGRYLDDFGTGRFQGIAGSHVVELQLDEALTGEGGSGSTDSVAPEDGALLGVDTPRGDVLIAQGWIYPTDSSINVAVSQGVHTPPVPLSLEVPDPSVDGGWRTAREGLGFPAGKHKTMLIDLDGLWAPGEARRLRLRTTMEIYWDRFGVAQNRPDVDLRVTALAPETADLRARGFSVTSHWPRGGDAPRSAPEEPRYDRIATTRAPWLDLAGRYTRFGDVRPLLADVDDRTVILNAGDEMAFRFAAPAAPPAGWTRDFVWESDGWVKDGDFNTAYSETVHPLPAHDRPEYADQVVHGPAGALEDDPIYRAHEADWNVYHTRVIGPLPFADVLRFEDAPKE